MSKPLARRLPTRRLATIGGVTAATAGLVASAGLVWHASYSAFSSQTTTPTNNWTAGTVAITNNQTGSALWTVTKLKPTATVDQKCITVTSTGNLPSAVKLYTTASSLATTKALSSVINLTVEQGTLSGGTNCATNFTADSGGSLYTGAVDVANINDFGTTKTNYSNGVGAWTTTGTGTETKVFRFSYSFNPTIGGTPNYTQTQIDGYQAGTASIGFTWEAQNT